MQRINHTIPSGEFSILEFREIIIIIINGMDRLMESVFGHECIAHSLELLELELRFQSYKKKLLIVHPFAEYHVAERYWRITLYLSSDFLVLMLSERIRILNAGGQLKSASN